MLCYVYRQRSPRVRAVRGTIVESSNETRLRRGAVPGSCHNIAPRRSSLRRRLRDRVTDAIAATLCQLMRLSGARFDDDRFNESYRPTTAVRRRPGIRPSVRQTVGNSALAAKIKYEIAWNGQIGRSDTVRFRESRSFKTSYQIQTRCRCKK